MNKIRQHIPNWISGYENQEVEFEGLDDLLAIEFVNGFKERGDFYRFSIDPAPFDNKHLLMAEYRDGKEWWVVGYLNEKVDLPKWKPVYEDKGL